MSNTPRQYSTPHLEQKIPVAIVGATGMVGRKFAELLVNHPYFSVQAVTASPQSSGQYYGNQVSKRGYSIPRELAGQRLGNISLITRDRIRLIFSAFEGTKEEIQDTETSLAEKGFIVVSNNAAHRWSETVPMMLPEVNPDHLSLIEEQGAFQNSGGGIVVKPNCSIQSYVPVLKAWEPFGIKNVFVVTEQSISGAGKTFVEWPEIEDTVIPYIRGEEEKSEREPQKVLGTRIGRTIQQKNLDIKAICTRVATSDGHMANVFVEFDSDPSEQVLTETLIRFHNPISHLHLPSSPSQFLIPMSDPERPQTRLDRDNGHGMSVTVGPIKKKGVNTYAFSALSHNTIRGAAGGAVLTAELLYHRGYLGD